MVEQNRDAGGYTPAQIRGLKIAIAVMTAAILIGLSVLVLTIAYRTANHKSGLPAASHGVDLHLLYPGSGPIAEAKLPPGGHVVSMTPLGDKILIAVEDYAGTSVLVLDPKSATILPLARLAPGP